MSSQSSSQLCPNEEIRFPSMWDVTPYRKHLASLVCGYCGRAACVPTRGKAQLQFCECSAGQRGAGVWMDRTRWREKHGDRILEELPTRKRRKKATGQRQEA